MLNYAFIFARGGSKGLPGKNVKFLGGKPLIQYSIEAAQLCSSIDRVFVSTEDEEIARIARLNNAYVISRPKDLASDTSPEILSWKHAINWVESHYGYFNTFVSLPTTSPLRAISDIESAIAKLASSKADICISITPSSRNPYFNMVKLIENDQVMLVNQLETSINHRQNAPEVYDITTVVYAANPSYIKDAEHVLSGRVSAITVPKERSVDIDDIYDFKVAETFLEMREQDD